MPVRLSGIALGIEEPEAALPERCARILGLTATAIERWRILRKSLDARDHGSLRFVYTVEVTLPDSEERGVLAGSRRGRGPERVELHTERSSSLPPPGSLPLAHPPVVIGAGPAGLVAAYFLACEGYRPIVLERGKRVRERIHDVRAFDSGGPLDPESNYLFGEGGAGTFSDGKLTCRSSGPDVRRVLELLAECKGKPSILYDYRPHLGSNRLPAVIKALRQRIEAAGGVLRFSCRVEDLDIREGQLHGVVTSSGYIPAYAALIAIGHSARDTYEMLRKRGVPMVQKPFQMGVRIEQPQDEVNRAIYGPRPWEEQLGAADYSVVTRGRHDLFSFCMCAGGQIIPSVSAPGYFSTNGMSLSSRKSPFANSGLMITVNPDQFGSEDVFAGIRLQEVYERKAFEAGRREYLCPIQAADDYLARRRTRREVQCSYTRGVVPALVADLVPPAIVESLDRGLPLLDRRWHGRFLKDAILAAPEARGSSPVRIVRDDVNRETPGIQGLYPVGEGAGYAGGIVSAAVDGLRSAKAIIAKFAPLEVR
jgi:uncharacterized FAD-dependent dehydrogenase